MPDDVQDSSPSDLEGGLAEVVDNALDEANIQLEDDFPTEESEADPPESRDTDTEDDDPPPDDEDDDTEFDYDDEDEDDFEVPDDDEDEEEEDDEDESEDDDEESEDDETEDIREALTRKEREQIEEDPKLKKAHASMQRVLTERTMAIAAERREIRAREAEVGRFREAFQDAQSFTNLLSNVAKERPDVAAAAFNGMTTAKGAEAFLLETAIGNPEVFKKVSEQLADFEENPDALEQHKRATQARMRETALNEREQQLNARQFQRDKGRIEARALRIARNLRIQKADLKYVMEDLEAAYKPHVSKENGSIDFSDAKIRESVKETKGRVDRVYREIAARERQRKVRASQKAAKGKAAKAKRRRGPAPRQRAARKASAQRPKAKRLGADASQSQRDSQFDQLLGHSVRQRAG